MQHFMSYQHINLITLLIGATLFGFLSQNVLALTTSGTTISNQAMLNYSVSGVPQTAISSVAATFTVDKKVDVSVVEVGGAATSVAPGQTSRITTFTVTNLGNDPQDIQLAGANVASGQSLFTLTDNFDTTGIQVFAESGVTAGYQLAEDTATFIDELAPGASKTVYVLATIPVARINGDAALVSLTATAKIGGTAGGAIGGALSETTGANTAGVDTVFADGTGSDDGSRDAAYSARDAYLVASSIISITKTATLLCDPVNGTTNPKNIPGATVRYSITVSNSVAATSSATLATISDTFDVNTAFEPNLITAASVCVTAESAAGSGFKRTSTRTGETTPAYYTTTNADADAANANAGVVSVDFIKALPIIGATHAAGELKPGESTTVIVNVTIN